MSTNNRRPSFTLGEKLLFTAGILFCLVLISTAMMGGLFARYTTSSSGHDNARVAKFGDLTITETGDFVAKDGKYTGIIIPGVNLRKKVTLDFTGSEMATIVFVEVNAPGWEMSSNTFRITDQLEWAIADGWTYLKDTEYVYYRELPPNTYLKEPTDIDSSTSVDIIQEGIITVSTDIRKSNIQALDKLNLSFTAYVIQNDGSLTPATAWDRLK